MQSRRSNSACIVQVGFSEQNVLTHWHITNTSAMSTKAHKAVYFFRGRYVLQDKMQRHEQMRSHWFNQRHACLLNSCLLIECQYAMQ